MYKNFFSRLLSCFTLGHQGLDSALNDKFQTLRTTPYRTKNVNAKKKDWCFNKVMETGIMFEGSRLACNHTRFPRLQQLCRLGLINVYFIGLKKTVFYN